MKKFAGFLILFALTAVASAQQSPLPEPSPVEKAIAARASDVTEVTMSKQMLAFAAKFMKEKDDAEARQLIQNLDGIYVRSYEFDKENQVTPEEVEKLRAHYETGEWTPMVRSRERKNSETADVMMKMVNGETRGMLVLASEPKELTIVLILGPIKPEDLSKLHGIGGLASLGSINKGAKTDAGAKTNPGKE
jgi:hypothetical protein